MKQAYKKDWKRKTAGWARKKGQAPGPAAPQFANKRQTAMDKSTN